MKQLSTLILLTALAAYFGLSLWDITVNGFLEKPTLNAGHFIAGPGGKAVVRLFLGIAALALLILWLSFHRTWRSVGMACAAAVSIWIVFQYSAFGMERYGAKYSEDEFRNVIALIGDKKAVHQTDVFSLLGEPLCRETQTILFRSRPHSSAWLYTYMPSCGFGWQKRVIYFGQDGTVTDTLSMDEP